MNVFKLIEFTINGDSGVILGDFSAVSSVYTFDFEQRNGRTFESLNKRYDHLSTAINQLLELSNNEFLTIQRIDDFAAPIFNIVLNENKHQYFIESLKLNTIEIKPKEKKAS